MARRATELAQRLGEQSKACPDAERQGQGLRLATQLRASPLIRVIFYFVGYGVSILEFLYCTHLEREGLPVAQKLGTLLSKKPSCDDAGTYFEQCN